MFAKTAFVCALFAASAQVAVAQAVVQPACFMKVFSSFQTASPGHYAADQKTLCCKEAAEFKSRIQSDLCPSGDQAAALSSYKTACEEAGYGSCSNSTSSLASASGTASPSASSNSSAPYPVVYTSTSTYFDKECSCTKTTAVVTSGVAGATGLATGTGASGPFATGTAGSGSSSGSGSGSSSGSGSGSGAASGSPITPVSPSKTGSGPSFTGAATKNVGSVAAGLLAVAGIAMAL
ncbi:hypothetical protein HO173_003820 [Letharia columbiana]|uniref:Uncharacterized protein n=1 Tax=Letharia columbiana TaxID=112416 RepID=A0A8H6G0K6_9LECA|nr:uncharacterized protein HO173_003820 [Letharia columbiana]KAF6238186.1 hypothetical protein HO173_003820 [Letharia columbiana]